MSKRPFAVINSRIVFDDGEQMDYPPKTQEDKSALLVKLSDMWKPVCRHCSMDQSPIIRTDNRIVAMCTECNHRNVLIRSYSRLSDSELTEMLGEIDRSAERRREAVNHIIAARAGASR